MKNSGPYPNVFRCFKPAVSGSAVIAHHKMASSCCNDSKSCSRIRRVVAHAGSPSRTKICPQQSDGLRANKEHRNFEPEFHFVLSFDKTAYPSASRVGSGRRLVCSSYTKRLAARTVEHLHIPTSEFFMSWYAVPPILNRFRLRVVDAIHQFPSGPGEFAKVTLMSWGFVLFLFVLPPYLRGR